MNKPAWLLALLLLACQAVSADQFLEPARLPAELRQLHFEDSQSGKSFLVRLDDNHLPVTQDFLADGVTIPFSIEGFLVDSTSGNRLHAWQVIPKYSPNGVAILLLHGNGGNLLSNLGGGIVLVKKGFAVTIVDYSGYGYSSGEATRENLLEDAVSTLDVVSARARLDHDRLVLYGQSLGGHLAVVVAAQHAEKIDALVIEGAFTSHKAIAAAHKGALAKVFVHEPYSAIQSIADYTKPLLVIHSRDDEVVPFAMGQQLFEAANEPKAFLEIGQAHLAGLALYADQIADGIRGLLDRDHGPEQTGSEQKIPPISTVGDSQSSSVYWAVTLLR